MNGWHIYVTVAKAELLDNPQMSDFREANMWLRACHSTENTGLCSYWEAGWKLGSHCALASLPVTFRVWVGVHVCVRVYIFMQWVFKELSTEAGFPQTIITSTPDTPNFLSWYFFLSFLFSVANPRGENPQHTACRIEMIFSCLSMWVPSEG